MPKGIKSPPNLIEGKIFRFRNVEHVITKIDIASNGQIVIMAENRKQYLESKRIEHTQ